MLKLASLWNGAVGCLTGSKAPIKVLIRPEIHCTEVDLTRRGLCG